MTADGWWTVVAAVLMVIGLCGVVIPFLPGLALIWVTAVVYGFVVGWGPGGIAVVAVLSALLAASIATSFIVPKRTAAASGASTFAQFGGLVGAVIGFFVIPVVGVIVGALAGVLVVEMLVKGNWDEAWTATKGTAKGLGVSALIDLGFGLLMIVVWSTWAATVVFG